MNIVFLYGYPSKNDINPYIKAYNLLFNSLGKSGNAFHKVFLCVVGKT